MILTVQKRDVVREIVNKEATLDKGTPHPSPRLLRNPPRHRLAWRIRIYLTSHFRGVADSRRGRRIVLVASLHLLHNLQDEACPSVPGHARPLQMSCFRVPLSSQ